MLFKIRFTFIAIMCVLVTAMPLATFGAEFSTSVTIITPDGWEDPTKSNLFFSNGSGSFSATSPSFGNIAPPPVPPPGTSPITPPFTQPITEPLDKKSPVFFTEKIEKGNVPVYVVTKYEKTKDVLILHWKTNEPTRYVFRYGKSLNYEVSVYESVLYKQESIILVPHISKDFPSITSPTSYDQPMGYFYVLVLYDQFGNWSEYKNFIDIRQLLLPAPHVLGEENQEKEVPEEKQQEKEIVEATEDEPSKKKISEDAPSNTPPEASPPNTSSDTHTQSATTNPINQVIEAISDVFSSSNDAVAPAHEEPQEDTPTPLIENKTDTGFHATESIPPEPPVRSRILSLLLPPVLKKVVREVPIMVKSVVVSLVQNFASVLPNFFKKILFFF